MDTTIDDYFIQIGAIPLLDITTEKDLLKKASEGNKIAKEKIIKANLRLVVDVAKKYTKRGLPLMDLIQEGNMGLMYAVDKFDLKFGCRFSTYATGWIKCYILRGLSDTSHLIRLPRRVVDEMKLYRKAWDSLTVFSHKEPTEQELADEMGVTMKKLKRIKNAMLNEVMISFDMPIGEDNATLSELLTNNDDEVQEEYVNKSVISVGIKDALNLLSVRERVAIIHKYGLFDIQPKTYEELSKLLCLSDEGARQVVDRAFKKLQAEKRLKKLRGLI